MFLIIERASGDSTPTPDSKTDLSLFRPSLTTHELIIQRPPLDSLKEPSLFSVRKELPYTFR